MNSSFEQGENVTSPSRGMGFIEFIEFVEFVAFAEFGETRDS
jgi:hypothetical protein